MSKIDSNIAKEMGYIPNTVINSQTGRRIKIGGSTYKKLLKEGIPLLDLQSNEIPKNLTSNISPEESLDSYNLEKLPKDVILETLLRLSPDSLNMLINSSLMVKKISQDPYFKKEYQTYHPFKVLHIEDRRSEIVPDLTSKKVMIDLKNVFPESKKLKKSKNSKVQIDPTFLREVYIPIYEQYPKEFDAKQKALLNRKENITDQKIDGEIPFFMEGEQWPIRDDGQYLSFYAQFVDPREGHQHELVRVFLNELDDIHSGDPQKLDRFNINDPLYPIEIEPDYDKLVNRDYASSSQYIVGWILTYEYPLAELDRLYTEITNQNFNDLHTRNTLNFIRPLFPYDYFKIGGYGNTSYPDSYPTDIPFTFISNIYPGDWTTEFETLHLDENGVAIGDVE